MVMAERKRLSADDWTAAALRMLADGGLAAVAVEPLAARLGTTKGSFYWHFANRDALLEATLARWERTDTEDVIATLASEPDPTARLRALFALGIGGHPESRVELALQPTAAHPLVAPVLARVSARRIDYLAEQFAALGFDAPDAQRRSLLAYAAYLGHTQLVHATPALAPTDREAYTAAVVATLTAPTPC
jgi:AcrR family transcriptional regulator